LVVRRGVAQEVAHGFIIVGRRLARRFEMQQRRFARFRRPASYAAGGWFSTKRSNGKNKKKAPRVASGVQQKHYERHDCLKEKSELDGTPTGATFANEVGCCFREGTTDGRFNYAVRSVSPGHTVYRFNRDGTDPQVMPFPQAYTAGVTGIAYDSSDDTFWLAYTGDNAVFTVFHMTRAGEPISLFFGSGPGTNLSLAYAAADDTLWVYSWAAPEASQLMQFATTDDPTGDLRLPLLPLSSQPGIGYVTAIEFQVQAVPEPAASVLLTAGLAVLGSMGARGRSRCRTPYIALTPGSSALGSMRTSAGLRRAQAGRLVRDEPA
jgi:hypothetical protein